MRETLKEILREFIAPEATTQLNITNSTLSSTRIGIETSIDATRQMRFVFSDAQEEIEGLLMNDIYPRFVRHQITTVASKALVGDRRQFQGLGDCFCLTDPSLVSTCPLFKYVLCLMSCC